MKHTLNKLENRLKIEPELRVGIFIECDKDNNLFEQNGIIYTKAQIESLNNDVNCLVIAK